MKTHTILAGAVLAASSGLLAACGNTPDIPAKSESYSYDFRQNGCPTGKHTFTSKAQFCSALTDHSLNGGCAEGLRREAFVKHGCSGAFASS